MDLTDSDYASISDPPIRKGRFKACGEIVRVQISVKTVCGLWWPGLTDDG